MCLGAGQGKCKTGPQQGKALEILIPKAFGQEALRC